MKARTPIPLTSAEKKQLYEAMTREIARKIEAERKFVSAVTEAIMCLALYKEFGFGETRLKRICDAADKQALEVHEWVDADIAEYMLSKRLKELGLNELAEIILSLGHERERWERL